jgi:hypothetical protein
MNSTRMGSHLLMDIEESTKLSTDIFEITGLESIVSLSGVSVYRIRNPNYGLSLTLNSTN